ncbi:hypothetical protein ABZX92_28615 [Lentzea sp. NPDC006480]|uniref:hypothetical protein n=1 Tax=Lentzea sp. NPDC006480 TaxID=3157176 RepID=UPI00339E923C
MDELTRQINSVDPAVSLRTVGALRRLAEQVEATSVARARQQGWSWEQIGDALDVDLAAARAGLDSLDRAALSAIGINTGEFIGSGIFTTDLVSGCPPRSPATSGYTWHGLLHAAFAQTPGLVELGGLCQRLTITIGFTWLTLFGAAMLVNRRDLG